jgi:hypothetical protein
MPKKAKISKYKEKTETKKGGEVVGRKKRGK